mmetsp:Transcript_28115/g.39083  ORF Transcript_28115/g.39083 Transcript_28115/m.39083 type:complete len:337 (+) Transcript_28115:3-1013(+)
MRDNGALKNSKNRCTKTSPEASQSSSTAAALAASSSSSSSSSHDHQHNHDDHHYRRSINVAFYQHIAAMAAAALAGLGANAASEPLGRQAMKFIAAAASTPPSSASFHHPTLCTPFPPLKHPGIANSVFQGVDFHSSSNTSQRLRRRNNNRNSRITAKNSDLRKHTGTWQSEHTSSSSNNTKNVPRNAKCNSADARKKRKLQHVVTSIQLPVLDQIRTRKDGGRKMAGAIDSIISYCATNSCCKPRVLSAEALLGVSESDLLKLADLAQIDRKLIQKSRTAILGTNVRPFCILCSLSMRRNGLTRGGLQRYKCPKCSRNLCFDLEAAIKAADENVP